MKRFLPILTLIVIIAFAVYYTAHAAWDTNVTRYKLPNNTTIASTTINTSFTPPNLNRGLVGWWTFDGNKLMNNITDSSNTGANGDLIGFTTSTTSLTTAGVFGQAIKGFALGSYISMGTNSIWDSSQLTICGWGNLPLTNTDAKLVSKEGGNNGWKLAVFTDATLEFEVRSVANGFKSTRSVGSPVTIKPGQWYLLCGQVNSGVSISSWVNGKLDRLSTGATFTMDAPTGVDAEIARSVNDGSNITWPGAIDDVRIWNRLLSAQEMKQLYQQGLGAVVNAPITTPNLNAGLVGWWTFDGQNFIKNAADSSGNSNTGQLFGNISTSTVAGVLGQALSFDGSQATIEIPNSTSLNIPTGGSVTMAAWVYDNTGSVAGIQGLMAKRASNCSAHSYGINFSSGVFQVYTSGSSGVQAFGYNVPAKKWTFIVGVMSAKPTALYVNGALFGTAGTGGGVQSNSSHLLYIGSSCGPGSETLNGYIDDVRVYNRALSAQEVKQLYQLGI